MSGHKSERVTEDIHRHLTEIFRELKDPRIDPLLTIVKVELSNDLSSCKVYVSSLDGIERARTSVEGLKKAEGFIRRELFSRVHAKRPPEVKFFADDSSEKGRELLEKIKKLNP